MELRHLRYFVAVAELENVSRAALKLHVSQPALSAQIRDLEDELGFDLLERTPKSVRLTIAGRVFLDQARAVLEHVDLAVKSARAAATGGETELHVGYLGTPTAHLLPAILRAFQKSMPNVQVRLHEQSNEQNLRRLRERQVDLAFVVRTSNSPPLAKLAFEPLAQMHPRLAVAPDHQLARRRSVSLGEAVRERFVAFVREDFSGYHEQLAAVFAKVKGKPRIVEECDSFSSFISAIEAGTGVALVSDAFAYSAGERVKVLRFSPEPKPATLGVAAREGKLSSAAEQFWRCAKQVASQK
jgi:LysR family transcriptional regulator, benzoate and cis,cis-muconate-responsive activator of ben and cat genes